MDSKPAGKSLGRVLIVEDEGLISFVLEATLGDAGYDIAGIAATLPVALAMIDDTRPDAAILDLNLQGEKVYPAAQKLADAGIPFVFATGGGTAVEGFADRPRIGKPFREEELLDMVARLMRPLP